MCKKLKIVNKTETKIMWTTNSDLIVSPIYLAKDKSYLQTERDIYIYEKYSMRNKELNFANERDKIV